jgi:hypothetical protein
MGISRMRLGQNLLADQEWPEDKGYRKFAL